MKGFKYSKEFQDAVEKWYSKLSNPIVWDLIEKGNITTLGMILDGYTPEVKVSDIEKINNMDDVRRLQALYARDKEIKKLYKKWKREVANYVDAAVKEEPDPDDYYVVQK